MKQIRPKKHYTFTELAERLGCSLDDIIQMLIDASLVPCIFLQEDDYCVGVIKLDDDGGLYFDDAYDADGPQTEKIGGFQYLVWPKQTNVSECEFQLFHGVRWQPTLGTYCYLLRETVGLAYVLKHGVVLAKDADRLEAYSGKVIDDEKSKRPLETRERNTLLTIIAALCKEAKIDISAPSKAGDLIQSLTDSMGAPVAKRTIEEHLKKIPDALATRMK